LIQLENKGSSLARTLVLKAVPQAAIALSVFQAAHWINSVIESSRLPLK